MREIAFSIPVSGVVQIDGNRMAIIVNRAETSIVLNGERKEARRISFDNGMTMFDIALQAAREVVRDKGVNRFTAAELYHRATDRYPDLKRNSFTGHVIASAPDHGSYKHYIAKRDYFSYLGGGIYGLNNEYLADKASDDRRISSNR